MTDEEVLDKIAEVIRDAFDLHQQSKHGLGPLTPWDMLPEARKVKWRRMAQAAREVIRS